MQQRLWKKLLSHQALKKTNVVEENSVSADIVEDAVQENVKEQGAVTANVGEESIDNVLNV